MCFCSVFDTAANVFEEQLKEHTERRVRLRVTRKPQFTKTKKLLLRGGGSGYYPKVTHWVTFKTKDGGGREGVCFFKGYYKVSPVELKIPTIKKINKSLPP